MAGKQHDVAALLVCLMAAPVMAQASSPETENDGLDPTRPVRQAKLGLERLDLGSGVASWKLESSFNQPVGDGFTVLRAVVPFAANSGLGDDAMRLGDASFKVTRVLERTRTHGIVLSAELAAPTAARADLGTGKWVLKPSAIYALFLPQGILAPSLLHNVSIAGNAARPDVNLTTFDLYFVPKLSDPKLLMTLDPALNHDWQRGATFLTLAATVGVKLGPMLGGRGQITVKPSIGLGANRPYDWGLAVNYVLLGF